MASTPTETPVVTEPSTATEAPVVIEPPVSATPTVRLPDTAVIRPAPPARVPPTAATTRGMWIAIVALVVLLVAGLGVIAWQQTRVDEASSDAAAAQAEAEVSALEAQALQGEVARLEQRLAQAQTRTEGLERRVERLEAQLDASSSQGATLAQTQAELAQTEAELAQTRSALATAQANEAAAESAYREAREELHAIAGIPLADGTWTGRLYMVGGTQIPPMLAYDEMKLFQGQAAIDAMIADGIPVTQAEDCGADCIYWRNPEPGWRIMTIAPDAPVILKTFQGGGEGPRTIGLTKFSRLFNGTAPQNAHFASAPYRLTMSGGEVTGIEEMTVTW